jgi:hypothetical protein
VSHSRSGHYGEEKHLALAGAVPVQTELSHLHDFPFLILFLRSWELSLFRPLISNGAVLICESDMEVFFLILIKSRVFFKYLIFVLFSTYVYQDMNEWADKTLLSSVRFEAVKSGM